MEREPVSTRRRQVMAATLASIAAPVVLAATGASAETGEPPMIVSGRILGADLGPLAGATIEARDPEKSSIVTVITDADGRFFVALPRARRGLDYRISHPALGTLPSRQQELTHVQRDEAGVWRASLGIALA